MNSVSNEPHTDMAGKPGLCAEPKVRGKWRKMKNNDKEIIPAEDMLCELEDKYVSACARFLARNISNDSVWKLIGKDKKLNALIINSKSTIIPVFNNLQQIPLPKFLGGYFQLKKLHSIQGIKEEVIILENVMRQFGQTPADIFDYDLMALDSVFTENMQPIKKSAQVTLRPARMTDLDTLAPLQSAYEHEEVLHKGSSFSAAASRVNLSNIIAKEKILLAEINGEIIGKINVSGNSYTRCMIGGVYIRPDFRRKGIAQMMTSQFVNELLGEGKGITLFVKKTNIAACKLYTRLGFKIKSDYRITYY
ncbi:MAG: GNAT family N-acetyltransferase [Treponema sp.]|nr:GNAT family N-acetyltransferase [Treponema sp.]MCL2250810.1 GNAT family N-acetyltransferase [Treponema sp.]